MAEAMLKVVFPDKSVTSAGIAAVVDEPADPRAVDLMRKRGVDLRAHRGRQLEEGLMRNNDLLLVMEEHHQVWIEGRWPHARGKVYRWGHWSQFDVPDPHGADEASFFEALALIERGLRDWKERL